MSSPGHLLSSTRDRVPTDYRLLPATIVAAYLLILLGIYTAASGAGLACDARWPVCDGAVFGLFPANWPSFIEWFHRLVAMVTGVMILGSWWVVWRGEYPRRSVIAMTVAVVLLPVQIWLGAETVLSYEILILTGHFLLALIIFGSLLLAAVWGFDSARTDGKRISHVLTGALVLFVPFVALTPHFLVIHSGPVQVAYYGLGVGTYAAFIVVAADTGRGFFGVGVLAGAGVLFVAVQLLAGRLVRSSLVTTVDWLGAVATLIVLALALWMSRRARLRPAGDDRASSPG